MEHIKQVFLAPAKFLVSLIILWYTKDREFNQRDLERFCTIGAYLVMPFSALFWVLVVLLILEGVSST